MSGLDPKGPSQPTLNQAYTTPGNPTTHNPSESQTASQNASDNTALVDSRVPTKQTSDPPSDLNAKAPGGGVHGAPAGEEKKGLSEEDVGRHKELDAEQMAAPGEGRVADAVSKGGKGMGGGGSEPDLASDLDRKKAEQAEAREAIKQQKGANTAVGGETGQSGGPANPVDKDGYPNSGVRE